MTDKHKHAAECFRKGTEAMSKQNWDYAVKMFDMAIVFDPPNLMYRQTKRGCSQRKYKDNGSGAKLAGVKLMKVRTLIKKAKLKKDWPSVDRAAEDGLAINPWDASLHFELAEACREREFDEVAVDSYKKAVNNDNKNLTYLKTLGEILRERGEYTEALKQWERIMELQPEDEDARRMVAKLLTEQTMDRGGYEDAKNTRDVKVESSATNAYAEDRAARAGKMSSEDAMTEEVELQRAIRKEPESVNNYLRLADHYRAQRELEKAAKTLKDALDVSGGDANVREQLEDVELDRMRQNVFLAREDANKHKDNEKIAKRYNSLKSDLVKREIEVLGARVDRYPKDMRLKMELGRRFKTLKEFSKAIPLFQQSVSDVRLKSEALVLLGDCFVQEKKTDLARRQYAKALEGIDPQDEVDRFKHAHYYLGRIYQSQGKREEAENHYTEVLGVDYEYKDVLKRLEKLQSEDDAA